MGPIQSLLRYKNKSALPINDIRETDEWVTVTYFSDGLLRINCVFEQYEGVIDIQYTDGYEKAYIDAALIDDTVDSDDPNGDMANEAKWREFLDVLYSKTGIRLEPFDFKLEIFGEEIKAHEDELKEMAVNYACKMHDQEIKNALDNLPG